MVDCLFHAVREADGVGMQQSCGIAPAEETVIDIDVIISCLAESESYHCVSLFTDERVIDVDAVCVPRTPSHDWGCGV